jgi:hypothetical protein
MSQRRMSMRLNPNPIGARRAKGITAEVSELEWRRAKRNLAEVSQAEWRPTNCCNLTQQQNIGADASEADDSDSSESSESNQDQNIIVLAKKKGRGKTQIRQNAKLKDQPRLKVIGDNVFEVKPYCTGLVSTITQIVTQNIKGSHLSYNEFSPDEKEEYLRAFLVSTLLIEFYIIFQENNQISSFMWLLQTREHHLGSRNILHIENKYNISII